MPEIKKSAIVPYPASQMFDLVNAVEHYPEFVPWCEACEILSKDEDEIRARLAFARGGLSKSFTTCNRLQKDKMIEIKLLDGPFHHLEGFWLFEDLDDSGSKISLELDYEISGMLLAMAFGPIFDQVANMLVEAFSKRADAVYSGKSSE